MTSEPRHVSVSESLSDGAPVDLRPSPGFETPAVHVDDWRPDREIDASILAELVTLPTSHPEWTHHPLWLAGARIVGLLDLEGATLTRPLRLEDCLFEQRVVLRDVVAGTIELPGCHVPGLDAQNLQTRGDLRLDRGLTANGQVVLAGAHIGGQLNCGGSFFAERDGPAILADQLVVDGNLLCNKGFTATGAVRFVGARVGGQFVCRGGTFNNPGGHSLEADNLTVQGNLLLTNGFTANGAVRLPSAYVGGLLSCGGGTFNNPSGYALDAPNLTVGGSMFCNNGLAAYGAVNLRSAAIAGQLTCDGGTFTNRGGVALNAAHLRVNGDLLCGQRFSSEGEVNLMYAQVAGRLDCTDGMFNHPGGTALEGTQLRVDGDVLLRSGFSASGSVSLSGARIGGQLDADGGTFETAASDFAIVLERTEVAQAIYLRPSRLSGQVDLANASAGAWHDARHTWPDRVRLHGFRYEAIDAEPPVAIGQRLEWLRRDPEGFSPQPYEQLASALRRQGNDHDARAVLINAQWRRRLTVNSWADRVLLPVRFVWSLLLRITLGYGYKPWRILLPIAALYAFGWWWFDRAEAHGHIVAAQGAGRHVDFHAGLYTADVLAPGVSLGVRDDFVALGHIEWWTSAYAIAGWLLLALFIAGLAGVFKRLGSS
jgi:hypothetical protein